MAARAAGEQVCAAYARFRSTLASGRRTLRAVRHPIGFVCRSVLCDGSDGVCVHVFGAPEAKPDGFVPQVCCHGYDLTSTGLRGEPTHRVFEVHSDPSGVDELRPTTAAPPPPWSWGGPCPAGWTSPRAPQSVR